VQMAERLRRLVDAATVKYSGGDLKTTISIGVAGFPSTQCETPEQLVEAADQAMYRAKHEGRNRVRR